jgi:AraC-like DNA-binding protein
VGLLIVCLTAISLSYILLVFEKRNVPLSADTFEYSAFFIMILVFYAVQSVSLLFFPEILYGLPRARELAAGNVGMDGSAVSNNEAGQLDSYGNEVYESGESELAPEGERDPFQGLADAIVEYMHGEKPYLNQDFSVTDIVIRLGAPRHHVEYCFSRLIGERFTDFKKRLRVEHAISILPVSRGLSMEGVGRESGFASKSVFYHSFREITGKTPAEYLRQRDAREGSEAFGENRVNGGKGVGIEACSKEG